mgnify:CR=1 FL=1
MLWVKSGLFISESLSDLKQALSKEKGQIEKHRIQNLLLNKLDLVLLSI